MDALDYSDLDSLLVDFALSFYLWQQIYVFYDDFLYLSASFYTTHVDILTGHDH